MTYRCGIGEGMRSLGIEPRAPHVQCDEPGCLALATGETRDGHCAAWLRKGTAPPGWVLERDGETRKDWCPLHRTTKKARPRS